MGSKPHRFSRPASSDRQWERYCDPGGDRYRYRERGERTPWTPTSCGMAFRITDLGREVLGGEKAVKKQPTSASLHIGPDFEIVAPRAEVPQEFLLRLNTFATALDGHPSDPVRRYRLEKSSLMRALKAGLEPKSLRADLEAHSGRPLPENVARTLDDWVASFGTLELFLDWDLVEFDGASERADVLAQDPKAEPLTKRFALAGRRHWPKEVVIINYNEPPRACLSVNADRIHIDQINKDLLVERQIAKYAENGSRNGVYQLTREAVIHSGQRPRDILDHLRRYSKKDVPNRIKVAVNGWLGTVAPLPVQTLTVIRIKDPLVATGILEIGELRECILGELSPGLLVIRKGSKERLRRGLDLLGITFSDSDSGVSVLSQSL